MQLESNALLNLTDSGGVQEESCILNVPCVTLRNNTERPETIELGTNKLLGVNPKAIGPAMENLFTGNWKIGQIPHLWDGKTAERIVQHLLHLS